MKTVRRVALSLMVITAPLAGPAAAAEVEAMLEKIRSEHQLPALGGLAIVDGEVKAIGAVGMRKFEGKHAVTVDDKWHIGSCTKSMTATLAATFVEAGALGWDATIGEVLGGKVRMRADYQDVTLKMLVTNRSGIPGSAPGPVLLKAAMSSGNRDIAKRRKQFAEALLKMKPEFPPGTQYAYSNSGFVVAGVMLEVVSGKPWEELMQERIFAPLKMGSAGFGGAASRGKEDQPWGHHSKGKPQAPGPGDDNPDVIGPAGTVHCSLSDLGRYVKMHVNHEVGPVLKKPESFVLLQEIADGNDDYACGWVVYKRPWANGPALMHNGSNTMNFCLIWMAPGRGFAAIAVSNTDNLSAAGPCDSVVAAFIEASLAGGDAVPRADGKGDVGTKVSPFSGVRWDGDDPVVKLGGEWFELVSLDGIAATEMVEVSQRNDAGKWKMRFAEDLVELLEGMGHSPKGSVQLVVRALDSSATQTIDDVAMTKENRDAIRSARIDAGE